MKTTRITIRTLIRTLSVITPSFAAWLAFRWFQTPVRKLMTEKERSFYKNAERFIICHDQEDLLACRLGNPGGKIVFLVHGWESNAGSMAAIAYSLVQQGYNVIAFDLPAHGYSGLPRTNLLKCHEAFLAILSYFNPTEFSVIAHSFGSVVASYTLSHSKYNPEHLVYLTAPDQVMDIFSYYRDTIGLGKRAYQKFLDIAQSLFSESLNCISTSRMTSGIEYCDLLLIHDRYDKVLPFEISVKFYQQLENASLEPFENVGHYRMLWNPDVVVSILSHWRNLLVPGLSVA